MALSSFLEKWLVAYTTLRNAALSRPDLTVPKQSSTKQSKTRIQRSGWPDTSCTYLCLRSGISVISLVNFSLQIGCIPPKQGKKYAISEHNSPNLSWTVHVLGLIMSLQADQEIFLHRTSVICYPFIPIVKFCSQATLTLLSRQVQNVAMPSRLPQ